MKIYRIVLVLAGLLIFGLSSSHAQMMGQGEEEGMMGEEGMDMAMMDQVRGEHMGESQHFFLNNAQDLDLTNEQIDKLSKIKRGFEKRYILDKANLKVAKIELEELLENDSVNIKTVEKKIKEITNLKGKLMLDSAKVNVEAREILSKEQRIKASNLIKENKTSKPMHKIRHNKRKSRDTYRQ